MVYENVSFCSLNTPVIKKTGFSFAKVTDYLPVTSIIPNKH